jgi:hypothetical protein
VNGLPLFDAHTECTAPLLCKEVCMHIGFKLLTRMHGMPGVHSLGGGANRAEASGRAARAAAAALCCGRGLRLQLQHIAFPGWPSNDWLPSCCPLCIQAAQG